MTFETFLNLLIIALLTIGIIYAIVLEYRLSLVKENHRNLSQLIKQFYDASAKVARDLAKLKNLEEHAHQELKKDMDRAALMRDEIKYLLNKADQTKSLDNYALFKKGSPLNKEEESKSDFNSFPSTDLDTGSLFGSSDLSRSEEELLKKLKSPRHPEFVSGSGYKKLQEGE